MAHWTLTEGDMAVESGIRMDLDDTKAQALIAGIVARGKHPRPAFNRIAVDLERSAATTFRAEGRPVPWKPLSPRTIAMRRQGKKGQGAVGGSVKILQDRGALRQSVTGRARGSVRKFERVDLAFGTRLPYAHMQQHGRGPLLNQVEKVRAHRRGPYARTYQGKTSMVRAHRVKAHTRRVDYGPVPPRPYLLWQDEDVEHAIGHLKHFLVWGT